MITKLTLCMLAIPLAFASVNYSYDAAGRLIKADYGAAGAIAYTYDKAGNLTSRVMTNGSSTTGNGGTITAIATVYADPSAGIAQNTWIAVTGTNLVPPNTPANGMIWSNAPEFAQGKMPTQLGTVSVTVNGKPGYIFFFCSAATSKVCATDQINVLTPLDDTIGDVQIVVTNGPSASAPYTVSMKPVVPSLFLFDVARHVTATHADNSLLGPTTLYPGKSTPAKPGERIVIYSTGFALPAAGLTLGSSTQTGSLATKPVCTIDGQPAAVHFAGVIEPGLYQLNVDVPTDASSNDDKISCTYQGATTPDGDLIAVQQ